MRKYQWSIKTLLEAAYLTSMAAIIAISGLYIPQLAVFTIFLSAIPIAVLTVRTNEKIAIASILVVYVIILLFVGQIIIATTTVLSFSIAGLALGYGLKRKWQLRELFILSSAAYLLSMLLTILILNSVEGVNQIEKFIIEPFNMFMHEVEMKWNEVVAELGKSSVYAEKLPELKNAFPVSDVIYAIKVLIPSIFITSSALLGYVTLVLCKKILNRIGYDYKYLPSFTELRFSRGGVSAYVITFVLTLFIEHLTIKAALININFILSAVMIVCGASIFAFFINKAGIPKIIRILIYFSVFGTGILLALFIPFLHPANILIIITLIDSMFDFRKLNNNGE